VKYLLDTNVLVSAALYPHGTAGRAYDRALTESVSVVVCDYTLVELRHVFEVKFPDRLASLDSFVRGISPGIGIVATPEAVAREADVQAIRDPKDWPILRAAVAAEADAIITGDKDLLDAGLTRPAAITPAQFLSGHPLYPGLTV